MNNLNPKQSKIIQTPLLSQYCKRGGYDPSIFDGFDLLAEETLLNQKDKKISLKSIVRFREILNWHIPNNLRTIALECVRDGVKPITKSSATKEYGKRAIDQCPWFLLADNPHYKTSAPMQLYFPPLLEALKIVEINTRKRVSP